MGCVVAEANAVAPSRAPLVAHTCSANTVGDRQISGDRQFDKSYRLEPYRLAAKKSPPFSDHLESPEAAARS